MSQNTNAGEVSRLWSITSIIRKDLKLFTRDFLFLFLSALSLATFVVLYWVVPRDVDETISIGIRGADIRSALTAISGEEEGMALTWYDDTESLMLAVENKDIEIGIGFPDGFTADVAAGRGVKVTVFVRPSLPPEYSTAMSSMVREIAYAVAGYKLPVTEPDEDVVVLGVDRAGDQVPFRDKMRPLYAFMMLIMEAISLGALIASEIQERTLTALLSTPARIGDILAAKIILGASIAFSEAMLITLLIGGFGSSPGIVVVALILGAILVTGIAMIAGSADRYNQGGQIHRDKLVPEGVEGRVPYRGPISDFVYQLLGGLRSGMDHCGAETIEYLRTKAKFIRISTASLTENHPHDIVITHESPNYSVWQNAGE